MHPRAGRSVFSDVPRLQRHVSTVSVCDAVSQGRRGERVPEGLSSPPVIHKYYSGHDSGKSDWNTTGNVREFHSSTCRVFTISYHIIRKFVVCRLTYLQLYLSMVEINKDISNKQKQG